MTPISQQLLDIYDRQHNKTAILEEANSSFGTISFIRKGKQGPRADTMERLLAAMGYRLAIVKVEGQQ